METQNQSALIIFGSPHNSGFTFNALKKFMKHHNEIKDTIFIDSYKSNVKPCIDCKFCHQNDSCVFNDMNIIDSALKTVDKIIFATPVYNLSLPAPMKSIFDRMQRYYAARFFRNVKPVIKKEKQGFLIITCGSDDDFGIEVVRKQTQLISSIINCKITDEILIRNTDRVTNNNI